MAKMTVRGTEVTIISIDEKDYISRTDMVMSCLLYTARCV